MHRRQPYLHNGAQRLRNSRIALRHQNLSTEVLQYANRTVATRSNRPIPAGDVHEMRESQQTFANNHARRYHELRAALKADFMTE